MEITCGGYKKSFPVAYDWSNHPSLRVIFHLERVTECHSINPGQPPQTSNFSVANANWLNCPMRVLWLNFEKRIAALFPAERWCKKHAGAFLDMWCERMGLFLTIDAEIIIMYLCGDCSKYRPLNCFECPQVKEVYEFKEIWPPCKNKSSVHPMCNLQMTIQCTWFLFAAIWSAATWNKKSNGPRPFLKRCAKVICLHLLKWFSPKPIFIHKYSTIYDYYFAGVFSILLLSYFYKC